jgi:hypothetical protein
LLIRLGTKTTEFVLFVCLFVIVNVARGTELEQYLQIPHEN